MSEVYSWHCGGLTLTVQPYVTAGHGRHAQVWQWSVSTPSNHPAVTDGRVNLANGTCHSIVSEDVALSTACRVGRINLLSILADTNDSERTI